MIDRVHLIHVSRDDSPTDRPNAKEVYIIWFEDGSFEIPWPEGLTLRQALVSWVHDLTVKSETQSDDDRLATP